MRQVISTSPQETSLTAGKIEIWDRRVSRSIIVTFGDIYLDLLGGAPVSSPQAILPHKQYVNIPGSYTILPTSSFAALIEGTPKFQFKSKSRQMRLISNLGWSREQAIITRLRLRTFEEDWDAPGMEDYDEL